MDVVFALILMAGIAFLILMGCRLEDCWEQIQEERFAAMVKRYRESKAEIIRQLLQTEQPKD